MIFSFSAKPVGSLTTVSSNEARNPDIVSLTNGGFAIAWDEPGTSADDRDVYLQYFASNGTAASEKYWSTHSRRLTKLSQPFLPSMMTA